MTKSFLKARSVLLVLAILALMSGCKLFGGGGGGGSSSASSATVEGIATPSSVSVVSATNAN
jgi:hypothetical protein